MFISLAGKCAEGCKAAPWRVVIGCGRWGESPPEIVGCCLRQSRFASVRNPRCRRLDVGRSNCGARSAILLYSDRESASAKAFSLVEIHFASKSKSYSLASSKHRRRTCIEDPRIVLFDIAWAPALLSTWIRSAFPFQCGPPCSSTCSTARTSWVLMCSLPLVRDCGSRILNAASCSG